MYSVECMVSEHDNILKLLEVMTHACCGLLEGRHADDGDFRKMLTVARTYADKHHHGKEEQILFAEMTDRLGSMGQNLVQHGMLVEHDLGRLYLSDLETALNRYQADPSTLNKLGILAGATGYAGLLRRHIEKENQAVYPFAERSLPESVLQSVDVRVRAFEADPSRQQARDTALELLQELTQKYLV